MRRPRMATLSYLPEPAAYWQGGAETAILQVCAKIVHRANYPRVAILPASPAREVYPYRSQPSSLKYLLRYKQTPGMPGAKQYDQFQLLSLKSAYPVGHVSPARYHARSAVPHREDIPAWHRSDPPGDQKRMMIS